MRLPAESYQIEQILAEHFPQLRPSQQRGLAVWVYGTILAGSACQTAVVVALLGIAKFYTLRQSLREWLFDGTDKAAPCQTEVDVTGCFVPLLRWILSWWQGRGIALAIDPTLKGDQVVGLVVSVLYRGCAIPVAWEILPAHTKGAWMSPILRLLRLLRPGMDPTLTVLVLTDRGLWSRRLWKRIRDLGWHPLMRLKDTTTFAPIGQRRQPTRHLVQGPGHAWIGRGVAFKDRALHVKGTLIVVWADGEDDPWVILTDLAPDKVGISWYGLRIWIELGFRALKGLGWQWQKTRRTNPARASRHWLVLAVATLWVLSVGTRAEDAEVRGIPPAHLRTPPPLPPTNPPPRRVSVFSRGMSSLRRQFYRGRIWRRLWLLPAPWPTPPPTLRITYHASTG